ncbi:DUF885 family protein [Streptomyces lasiicapitis]|uniref:DUF885 domain-containing protein n=1 Tax=Streptomyces lasiicapitis TaxID=1923961 RepID=A0ABQ2M7V6_9ACTN|nr:DUF885 family protein [Streptomyces lasiicapitis]GGO47901.1 hypothetical protein GCM10012286_42260 [Streptomyces lasiicapitis]
MNTTAELAERFWAWRDETQPDSMDDLPRVERPSGWVADWSAEAVRELGRRLAEFEGELGKGRLGAGDGLDAPSAPAAPADPGAVDARLLGSALARVRWELDHLRGWQRNPCFYIDQALGPLYCVLLDRRPFAGERAESVLRHLRRVPDTLRHARENLAGHAERPFARSAVRKLDGVEERLTASMRALAPHLPPDEARALPEATETATRALADYRHWLADPRTEADFQERAPVGDLSHFLHRVALLPHRPERIRDMARQEWDRATALEQVLRARHRALPPAVLPATSAEQIARQEAAEREIRAFRTERGLFRDPQDLRGYRFVDMPAHLAPLTWLGVPDDLTSVDRATEDAVRYVPQPHPGLPFFPYADALDPRLGICHEGVHAQQLAFSWQHPNPVRRHFYDSTPNEGIAFHQEELLLSAGLFDDAPHSALTIVGFLRLRALRAEVDIGLANGDLTIEEATDRLDVVLGDRGTAWEEAVFFAGNPGQALSYQVGKLQINELIAELPGDVALADFHRRLWREGNVPLALQRWELLGRRDHLDRADALAGARQSPTATK